MPHPVTCVYCHKKFDRDKEAAVQISKARYAHKECAEHKDELLTQEEKDIMALEQYIMKKFEEPFVNARIKKQIKEYREEYNYTYSGMLKTLIWWFDIKGNSLDKANGGIGIIPFVYKDACDYYYALYMAEMVNEDKDINDFQPKQRVIEIASPRVYVKPPQLFNLDDDEEGED